MGGFGEYEDALRGALQELLGARVEDRQWQLATLGIKEGGIGLRSPATHWEAAFISSFQAAGGLAGSIDPSFDPRDTGDWAGLGEAIGRYNTRVAPRDHISAETWERRPSQKELSRGIDLETARRLGDDSRGDSFWRAHVGLVRADGGRSLAHSLPPRRGAGT